MSTRKYKKFIHEGQLAAEVEIELIDSDNGWAPYISLDDALKLDEVRKALRDHDVDRAAKYGRIYELKPIAV